MTYEITLLEADIKDAMDGRMSLALSYEKEQKAVLEYRWDATHFTAVFQGHAPSLPVPAHPTTLLQKPIAAMYAAKTDAHALITDIFKDTAISIEITK